jgi:hypothetical protein
VRARSGLQLKQAAGSTGEKKKEEASAKKRVWEKVRREKLNGFEQNMRKEKRGHAPGTNYCGRVGARGRPRHNGDATGWRGQLKRKRDGRLRGKRGRDCTMSERRKIGRWALGAQAAEWFKRFLSE